MQHVPILQEVLARNTFIIRKKDAMPWLPDKTHSIEAIEMTDLQKEMYRKVASQLAVEIGASLEQSEVDGHNRQLLINNVLTKLLRLAQVTSGFIIWDAVVYPFGEVIRPRMTEFFPVNPKIEWCVEKIKQHPLDEKCLFWSWMTNDVNALAERLTAEGISHVVFKGTTSDVDREEAERRFNKDPSCRVFIGNPAAGGSGLNLLGHDPKAPELYDTDATLSVYIAQNWNAVHRSQSEDRNHRRGTRRPTHIVTLVCDSTIDEDIHERVSSKRQAALEISDIRSLLTKLLGDLT
jgi:SNF2 family DNA or RNA helicase